MAILPEALPPVVFTKADADELLAVQARARELQRAQEAWQARFRHPLTTLVSKQWPWRKSPLTPDAINTMVDWLITNKDEIERIYALMEPINVRKEPTE